MINEKTIKIRFIYRKGYNNYAIQRKTWWGGWKYIGYTIDMGYGSLYNYYTADNRQKLLHEVLENYYKIDKRFVNVYEYPTIKHY